MRVLVTGATGFLGAQVARELLGRGHQVVLSGRDRDRGASLARATGAPFVAADLARLREVERALAGTDAVVHSAALSSAWGPPRAFDRANVRATENVIDAAERLGVRRLVHVSTPALYFDFGDHLGVTEDHPLPAPVNDYVRTKLAAERLARAAHARGLLKATIVRPRGIFGPGDTSILPKVVRALERGRFPVIGDGTNLIDMTYVDDAAHAVALALDAPRGEGGVYHVTSGEPLPLIELVSALADGLGLARPRRRISYRNALCLARALELLHATVRRGSEPMLTRYTVGLLATSMTLDLTRARRDLGYAPRVGVREGLARYIEAHRGERDR